MEDIFKKLGSDGDITLTHSEVNALLRELDSLKAKARDGELYRQETESEMTRLCSIAEPELPLETIKSVASRMTLDELKAFKRTYEKRISKIAADTPQLAPTDTAEKNLAGDSAYKGI